MAKATWIAAAAAVAATAGTFLSGCSVGSDRSVGVLIDAYIARQDAVPAPAWPAHMDKPVGDNGDSHREGVADVAQASEPVPPVNGDGPGLPAGTESIPRQGGAAEHWSTRRGPAYPDDKWRSVGRDIKELPVTLWDDTKATFTNKTTLAMLLAAGAAGALICGSGLDDTIEDCFDYDNDSGGSRLNTTWDSVGGFFGSPAVHFPLAGAMYATSLACNDVKGYETSKALINALAINGLTTTALKGIVHTRSPNGDDFGWPSGHTSSSFCLATVLHEAYGPKVGIPLYAFAAFVAYERIDARNHDLSDVVSGALIGIAIGHAVMQNHQPKVLGFDVVPFGNPESGSVGLGLAKQW